MAEKHYLHKRLACRNDYCAQCKQPRFTELYRYLVVLTKFGIPIFPIGFQRTWSCTTCGKDPKGTAPASKIGLFLGLVVGTSLTAFSFTSPFDAVDEGTRWALRIIFATLTIVVLYKFLSEDRAGYDKKRREVSPLPRENCPYCKKALEHRPRAICPVCNIEVC